MTMHKVLHPRDDVNRLYVSRKEEKDSPALKSLCIDTTTRRLHRKARRKTNLSHQKNTDNTMINRKEITQKTKKGRKTNLWTF